MYIKQSVIEKYQKLVNPKKIENATQEEIMFKIRMDMELGKRVYTFSDGSYLIHYFDMVFKCKGFRCIDVYRDVYNKPYTVKKQAREQYMKEYLKTIL